MRQCSWSRHGLFSYPWHPFHHPEITLVQVIRQFDRLYTEQDDPWRIGTADADRYKVFRDMLLSAKPTGKAILDIGCGFGAFLARFLDDFGECHGLELVAEAVRKGQQRFPRIQFHQGPANDLAGLDSLAGRQFDAILCTDLIYYLAEQDRLGLCAEISRRLAPGGVALIAAWCPGGDYLSRTELRHLLRKHFAILDEHSLATKHVAFLARPRRTLVSVTIDYETWQPIPPGHRIDWQADIFTPTETLLTLFDEQAQPVTLMAEMGEYFWLKANQPATSRRMEDQWRDAVQRGHDVQLHLHPHWLPELGARQTAGEWHWNTDYALIDRYPHDLTTLIGRCRAALEQLISPVKPDYTVKVFRAGGYSAQPFRRLHQALLANDIRFDSSVMPGAQSVERGFNYRHAHSSHQPYFANPNDPQLLAPPAERDLIELPIFTFAPGQGWYLDGPHAALAIERLETHLHALRGLDRTTEDLRRRQWLRRGLGKFLNRLPLPHSQVNRMLPTGLADLLADYPAPEAMQNDCFVMIGHTKAPLDIAGIRDFLANLRTNPDRECLALSELADEAGNALNCKQNDAVQEAAYQVERERNAILGEQRNLAQSDYLQRMLPLDGETILDLGCGAGYWSARIAEQLPWKRVFGLDFGADFVAKARRRYDAERVSFCRGDFQHLPFADQDLDCVYADNVLEHAFDVQAVLEEIHRVLKPGGCLIAALPPDAYQPERICDNHTWKTLPAEVRLRLSEAGFDDIQLEDLDTRQQLGMAPYPPSRDRMLYVRAWRRPPQAEQYWRASQAMQWIYDRLSPKRGSETIDPVKVIAEGRALCAGYTVALGGLLAREGFVLRWINMWAWDHERGSGPEKQDSHDVIELQMDGKTCILDPMSNTLIPHGIDALLANPELADGHARPDERYHQRGYQLYDTAYWYSRVCRIRIVDRLGQRRRWRSIVPTRIPSDTTKK